MKTVRVILIDPYAEKLQVDTIEQSLEAEQKYVDGYIELVSLQHPLFLIVNEEGIMRRLPVNPLATHIAGMTIFGKAIITRINPEGDSVDLTDDDIKKFTKEKT